MSEDSVEKAASSFGRPGSQEITELKLCGGYGRIERNLIIIF